MTGRSKVLIAFAAAVMLAAFGSSAGAVAATKVEKPWIASSFDLKGSNRYWIEVTAKRSAGEKAATVTVTATRERYKVEMVSASYSKRTKLDANGAFRVKLPGLGRIAVSFEPTKVHRVKIDGGPDCNDKSQLVHAGVFRGTIDFRGEGGFTKVKQESAKGELRESTRQVCHLPASVEPAALEAAEAEMPPGTYGPFLAAGGGDGAGAVYFSAGGPTANSAGIVPDPIVEADYSTRRSGMKILAQASVAGGIHYTVGGPPGALSDATVEPPAPFAGQGTFHAESSTTTSWTGDLSVALPGVCKVALVGPGVAARLCEGLVGCSGPAVPYLP